MIASIIEIVAAPDGTFPPEVREGWKGCTMPCEPECGHVPQRVDGQLEKVDGFSVWQDLALQTLAVVSPEAAEWFYANGYPEPNMCFRFLLKSAKIIREARFEAGPLHTFDDMEAGTMRQMT